MSEERPYLRPELPPEWWLEQKRLEEQEKQEVEENEERVIIIDL